MIQNQRFPLLLFFILFILTASSFAQKKPYEFEKITAADFSAALVGDTTAEAVVIADVGNTKFEYGPQGFYLVFERKTRIRILKSEGTSHATIIIPLYKTEHSAEAVQSFKGFTYNLEKGEVVKTKVRNEDIFKENVSENWAQQKVAMPAVRENSIVEYSYQVKSDFTFNLQPWDFQSDIPVNYSEYTVKTLEYFEYKKISHGYIPFVVSDVNRTTQKFTVHFAREMGEGLVSQGTPAHDEVYNASATEFRWVAVDVPALKPEPFITSLKNYLSSIEFELATVKMPNSVPREVADSWETINTKLVEDEDFGRMVKKGNFISDKLPGIFAGASTDLDKAKAIFNHVQQRVKWNENYGIYAKNMPRKVYEDRTGSIADINLMLVAMLKEAGLNADPVILSTRSHGMVMESNPILAKFNYVIALVKIDTTKSLLDATSPNMRFNTLPERCLNGNGRIVSKNNAGWARLLNSEIRNEYTNATFTLTPEGSYSGTFSYSTGGLSGNDRRNSFRNKQQKDFIKEFNAAHSTWSINDFCYKNLDTLDQAFNETYTFEASDGAQLAGDHIYMNVMAGTGLKSNPFKLEKRTYPVEFSCPAKETILIKIIIPEGWVVEELPKSSMVALPDKDATFKLALAQGDGFIQVTSTLTINKTMFLPDEYENLKEFFRLIATKHAEQIILKKA